MKAKSQGIPITQFEIDWLEKRNGLDSSLPALKTTLAMLIDLLVLRSASVGSRNLLGVQRVTNGFFKNPITGKTLASEITLIGSENSSLLKVLRRLRFQMSVQS